MNLIQKARSIWEGSSLTKKGKLCLSLTAIGIMGGFFVMQASNVNFEITSPTEGEYVSGIKEIQWTTFSGICTDSDFVNVQYSTGGGFTTLATVKCLGGKASWSTTAFADNGNYQIRIFKDGDMGINSLSKNFIVDNTKPIVDVETLTSLNSSELLAGGSTKTITWAPAKIVETNQGANAVILDYTIDDGSNWKSISTGTENDGTFNWTVASENSTNVKLRISAKDKAGNVSTTSDTSEAFKIDSTKPSAVTVALDKAVINDTNLTQTVTVTYSEDMNQSVPPVIALDGTTWGAQTQSWTSATVYTGSFTKSGVGEEKSSAYAKTSGAKDLAGNIEVGGTSSSFVIDTIKPTATATATPNRAKAGTVSVAVVFSEAMKISIVPTVGITGLTSVYTVGTGVWSDGDKKWTGSFNLTDEEEVKTATIAVSGAADAVGNVMLPNTTAGTFDIDTVSPTAVSIVWDTMKISDQDLSQEVTVTYNEAMSAAPAILFSAGSFTSAGSGSWDSNQKIWKQSFTTTDIEQEINTITATAKNAHDVAGNLQASDIVSSFFTIDTKNPTVVLSDDHTDNIVRDSDTVVITAIFTDGSGISENNVPKITIGDVVSGISMTKVSNLIWTYSWDVPSVNKENSAVSVEAYDSFGNRNIAPVAGISYTIDNTAPMVDLTYVPDHMVNKENTLEITATFSEPVIAPTIAVTPFGTVIATPVLMSSTSDIKIWKYSYDVPAGNDGAATVAIAGSDVAGNPITVPATHDTFTIDNTLPTITDFTAPVANKVYKTGVDLVFTATDANLDNCSYKIDGIGDAVPVSCTSGVSSVSTVAIPTDGVHMIVVTAVDKATNSVSATSALFIVDTNNTLTVGATGADFTTIQAAISAAQSGDTISVGAGLYEENLTIDKRVKIVGAGSGASSTSNTVIRKATASSAPIVTLAASGTSAAEPILFQDIRIEPVGVYGINVGSGNVSFIKMSNVFVIGSSPTFVESEIGLKVSETASLTDLFIENSSFSNCDDGWYFAKKYTEPDASTVRNITVNNTSFNNNDFKGIYVEKLSNATFTGVTVKDNGLSLYYNAVWNGGFDINLKNGNYQNLTFNNLTVTGNGLGYKEGAGFLIKARNDETSYNTFPATLSGVTIEGGTFNGNERGIRFGEPGKNNSGPTNVVVKNAKIFGNVKTYTGTDGSAYGDLVNQSTAEVKAEKNWWGTKVKSQIKTFGLVDLIPWFLNEGMTIDSGSDIVGPAVVLTSSIDMRTIVKAGEVFTITANITDINGVDTSIVPKIKITNGQSISGVVSDLSVNMILVSGDNWRYIWTVPDAENTTTVSVEAQDIIGNLASTNTTNTAKTFTIDKTAPIILVGTDGISSTPVKTDSIILNITESNAVVEAKYGFSANATCDASDTYATDFITGTAFNIAGDHTDYLCAMAQDTAGNIGYFIAERLNTDNTGPAAPAVILTDPITSGNQTTVAITGTGEANASISWKIKGSGTGEKTGTGTVDASGIISITGIDVATLADGVLTLSVTLTDAAQNTGLAGTDTSTKDVIIPTVLDITSDKTNGSYNTGGISVQVQFSELVIVTGTPQIELETGSIDRKADYVSGSGSDTLSFSYTVQANDTSSDLDYTSTSALSLNSGTIADAKGNAATLTLPTPGAVHSLGANKAIVIDTETPVIASHNNIEASALDASGVIVNYTTPSITNSSDSGVVTSCLLASGSKFALGNTTVRCNAVDAAGNHAVETTFVINVIDKIAPVIAVHPDVTAEGTMASGADVTFTKPSATDNVDTGVLVTCDSVSESHFNYGDTTVTCNASDAAHNAAIATTFKVKVRDTIAPTLAEVTPIATPRKVTAPVYVFSSTEAGIISYEGSCSSGTTLAVVGNNSITFNILPDGVYNNCKIKVTDAATNSSNKLAVSEFKIDTTAPVISNESPKANMSILDPIISATFTDASDIDTSAVSVLVTGGTIEFNNDYFTISSTGIVSKTAGILLSKGTTYKVTISGLKDVLDNANPGINWSFTVNGNATELDTTAPTATASTPQDGAINVAVYASPVITFSEAIDEDTLAGNVKLIPYGATEGLAATLTLSVDKTKITINPEVDLDNSAQYYFLVGAGVKDLAGNPISSAWSSSDKASHEFTTVAAHVPVTTKAIALKTGWNLVSLPLIPTNDNTVSILSAIISKVNTVQYYDGTSWMSYAPGAGVGSLTKMEDGKGYWIDVTENVTLTITGTEMPLPGSNMPLYQIKKGWNLIGFKSVSEMKSSKYLGGVSYVVVYSYDGTSNSYPTVAYPSSDPAQATDNNMKPGLGYWLYAKEEGYIVPVIK